MNIKQIANKINCFDANSDFVGHGQEDLVKDGHVVVIAHFDLIERHVNVVTESCAASNIVVIGFAQVRPEGAVLIAVDGEIQNSATQ